MAHARPRNPNPPRHRNRRPALRRRLRSDVVRHVGRPDPARQRGTARPAAMDMVHGQPQGGDDRGSAANLVDAKARFKIAWARIRASLTDQDIADAKHIAALSAEALARYDRRHGR
jgi:hypothetical protein